MSVWDLYQNRLGIRGKTKRDVIKNREMRMLGSKVFDSLSYHSVEIDSVATDVSIINTDNLNTKFIHSMPGEDLKCGSLVSWMDNHWLITERDANSELYTRAKMIQCNFLLKWIDTDGELHEQWCFIEDGTKYLTGEYEDRNFVVTRGDSRIAMTIAKNVYTSKFDRTYRFLIDDEDAEHKIAYSLTKPFKLGSVYNGDGVYCFVLQEVATSDDDNQELGVADYYKYYESDSKPDNPEIQDKVVIDPENNIDEDGRSSWL